MPDLENQRSSWIPIENQAQLEALHDRGFWEDAETVAFVADTVSDSAVFPADVSRSGYLNWNIRVLLWVGHTEGSHLEILLVDCDTFSSSLIHSFSLRGRIDSLKRLEVYDYTGQRRLRCSRVMYRLLTIDQAVARSHYGSPSAGHQQRSFI
jgi:hypothetical protein